MTAYITSIEKTQSFGLLSPQFFCYLTEPDVESGFSCNKDLRVPNLLLKSMLALRRVYDSIRGQNPATIEIIKELIDYVRISRADYELFKERDRFEQSDTGKRALAKKNITAEIKSG